jgi:predicted transcriptional regulator
MKTRVYTAVKLSQEERKMLETIAKSYDITISDVIRIAIREYAQKHRSVLEKISEGTT